MKSKPKYFRANSEDHEGSEGFFYCEVENEIIVRMINVFGGKLLWATPTACKDELYDFTDQPEFPDSDLPRQRISHGLVEISEDEFEALWVKAVASK